MENKVIAIVAGKEITDQDINKAIERYPAQQQAMAQSEQGRKQILTQIIGFELANKFGKENNYDQLPEYKEQLKQIESDLLTQTVMNKVLSEVTITDEEVKKYYDDNKEQFGEPERVSAKHILVASEDEAYKIKDEISNGLSFEDAARKYSSCPSKDQGGNLGEFSRGMMVPEFEEAAFSLPIGEVSSPVKTQFGYHLIQVDAKHEASTKSFEEVKQNVLNELMQKAQQKKYFDFLDELTKKYGVEYK